VSTAERARRPFGIPLQPRLLLLLLILPVAYLLRPSSHDRTVDQDRAVEIARAQIAYVPDGTNVRYVRRGLPSEGFWAVSLWQWSGDHERTNVTVVVLDATSGKVEDVKRNVDP
jgi:hypothetical protein